MTLRIEQIATIKPGYPFRGSIKAQKPGDIAVIQMRDATPEYGLNTDDMAHIKLPGRKDPAWLQASDILFVARGNKNFAVYIDQLTEKTVCTPHFFQIRIKSSVPLLPDFLVWQINQTPAQSYFSRLAQGSVLRNIKKVELAELPIVIPPLKTQQTIIALDQAMKQELQLLDTLVDNRRRMMDAIAQQTLNTQQNFDGAQTL